MTEQEHELEVMKAKCDADVEQARLRYAVPAREETKRVLWNCIACICTVIFFGFTVSLVPVQSRSTVMIASAVAIAGLPVVQAIVESLRRKR